jgi:hypothetical protein
MKKNLFFLLLLLSVNSTPEKILKKWESAMCCTQQTPESRKFPNHVDIVDQTCRFRFRKHAQLKCCDD